MILTLQSEQWGRFDRFQELLVKDLPGFVWKHPNVVAALEKWGLYSFVPEFHQQGTIPDARRRKQILLLALCWGTKPEVWVAHRDFFPSTTNNPLDAIGVYVRGQHLIMIHRPLIERWQQEPTDQMLRRWVMSTML